MEMPSLEMLRESHRILAEYRYEKRPVVHGYAGRTLYINLEELAICSKAVTAEMKEIFTGGRGFCLWLLWNGVKVGHAVGRPVQ